jgi:hypothetical protein
MESIRDTYSRAAYNSTLTWQKVYIPYMLITGGNEIPLYSLKKCSTEN